MLTKHGFTKNDIAAFAVASGPGSFTGLRIGLAAIKALAEVLQRPIAAVSLLEAIATEGPWQGNVTTALDAGRSEVYVGEYEISASGTRLLGDRLLSRDEWLEAERNPIVTADAVIAQAAVAKGLRVEQILRPRSDVIARLGWMKIATGQTISAEALEANYVRRSDADLFSKGNH